MTDRINSELLEGIVSALQKRSAILIEKSETTSQLEFHSEVREALEHFNALKKGFETGAVNYDQRKSDEQLDTDPEYVLAYMYAITLWLQGLSDNRPLTVKYTIADKEHTLYSNLERELLACYRFLIR